MSIVSLFKYADAMSKPGIEELELVRVRGEKLLNSELAIAMPGPFIMKN